MRSSAWAKLGMTGTGHTEPSRVRVRAIAERRGCMSDKELVIELGEALKTVVGLFAESEPFYIRKVGGEITNGEQDRIGAAFVKAEAALEEYGKR